jgi:hypothetical protein
MKMKPAKATPDIYQLPAAAKAAVKNIGTEIQAAEFLAIFKRYLLHGA